MLKSIRRTLHYRKEYVSAIIAKLQANDRTHAVVTALRRGLVEL